MQEIAGLAVGARRRKTLPVAAARRAYFFLSVLMTAGVPCPGQQASAAVGGAPNAGAGVVAAPVPAGESTPAPSIRSLLAPIEAFALDASAGAIDFRTLDIPPTIGQVAMIATMEKTFINEKSRPSLTARLASEDTKMQRVVSLKMVGGPLDNLAATTFGIRNGGIDEKRDALGRGLPVGQKFDLTFAWAAGRVEIRLDGIPRFRGELDFVPVFFHVQVQSGRVAVESIQFEKARFIEQPPAARRRKK